MVTVHCLFLLLVKLGDGHCLKSYSLIFLLKSLFSSFIDLKNYHSVLSVDFYVFWFVVRSFYEYEGNN